MRKHARIIVSFSIIWAFISCEDLGSPYTPPRIIPGVSIDGIRLGYTREQVEGVLGSPSTVGWADGIQGGVAVI